jgi:hypothetical protein
VQVKHFRDMLGGVQTLRQDVQQAQKMTPK